MTLARYLAVRNQRTLDSPPFADDDNLTTRSSEQLGWKISGATTTGERRGVRLNLRQKISTRAVAPNGSSG